MRQSTQGNGSMAKWMDMVGRISIARLFCFYNDCRIIIFLCVEYHFGLGVRNLQIGMYEGEHRDGELHGKGVLKYQNGAIYEGEFVDNLFDGTGTF